MSLIFGEPGTGKTTLAMQCAANYVKDGHTAIYIDSDGGFSLDRLSQIAFADLESVAPSIMVFSPRTFQEQSQIIESLGNFTSSRTGFVIFDSISSLYRLGLTDRRETFRMNRRMNRHLAYLAEIARGRRIAILLTSQVRTVFEDRNSRKKGMIEPVAARLLSFWSDSIVCFRFTSTPTIRQVELMKPRKAKSDYSCFLRLTDSGIEEASTAV